LLVDHQTAFRQALAFFLRRSKRIKVVAEVATARDAVELVARADVALVELCLPDGMGLDVLRAARERGADLSLLILTGESGGPLFAEAIERGAAGVLTKSVPLDRVVDAIFRLGSSGTLTPAPEMARILYDARVQRQRQRELRAGLEALTPREKEVLAAIVEGLPDREIAARLTVSAQTVRTHTVRIFDKLGVHSRLQAGLLAVRYYAADSGCEKNSLTAPATRPISSSDISGNIGSDRISLAAASVNGKRFSAPENDEHAGCK
jgi:DNA-binding NarL/FixJ family response regulator